MDDSPILSAAEATMMDKKNIINDLLPKAVLQCLTQEARNAVSQYQLINGFVRIQQFPFRIGRESRVQFVKGKLQRVERQKMGNRQPNNDLYLIDYGEFLNISREHLVIEYKEEDNTFLLHDRGSACGTMINDQTVGGKDSGGSIPLADGDKIVIGTKESPYRYCFIDLRNFEVLEKNF